MKTITCSGDKMDNQKLDISNEKHTSSLKDKLFDNSSLAAGLLSGIVVGLYSPNKYEENMWIGNFYSIAAGYAFSKIKASPDTAWASIGKFTVGFNVAYNATYVLSQFY